MINEKHVIAWFLSKFVSDNFHLAQSCWFCLSNPDLEKHLLIHLGEDVYVALAKGGLIEDGGHLLIIPMGHYQNLRSIKHPEEAEAQTASDTYVEIEKYKKFIKDAFSTRDEVPVMFEIFSGTSSFESINGVQHMHVQIVPVPNILASKVRESFLASAEKDGLLLLNSDFPENTEDPYIRIELPDGSVMSFTSSTSGESGSKVFNAQFGR